MVPTLLRMISGARYSGVPQSVQVLPFTRLANPKSVTYKAEFVRLNACTETNVCSWFEQKV